MTFDGIPHLMEDDLRLKMGLVFRQILMEDNSDGRQFLMEDSWHKMKCQDSTLLNLCVVMFEMILEYSLKGLCHKVKTFEILKILPPEHCNKGQYSFFAFLAP